MTTSAQARPATTPSAFNGFWALLAVECKLTLRRGESLLLTLGIPIGILVFFSLVDVLPTDSVVGPNGDPVDALAPGVLALAVMSTAMTGLAIATGFERSYGVLKRLGAAPLRRSTLIAAKISGVVVVELVQAAVLIPVGLALGWRPGIDIAPLLGGVVFGTTAFAGLGLLMAGRLKAELTLALANGLYLVLLLLGGFIIPLDELPGPMRSFAELLPAASLTELIVAGFGGVAAGGDAWLTLIAWSVLFVGAASKLFRWEPDRS